MTVCIATLFTWSYSLNDTGIAALTMSDRMITAGDIEYEPPQIKTCFLTNKIHILIAGDYPTHSEALMKVQKHIAFAPESTVAEIAEIYADSLAAIKHREAARTHLSPIGLTSDTFISRQNELSPDQVSMLTQQMQGWRGPSTEALIVGADENRAHVWMIDRSGALSCENDIGFSAIGIGAWHAKSQFMQARWAKVFTFADALAVSFAAKKSAEIAPGVGPHTDMHIITRHGSEPVSPATQKKLTDLYAEYEEGRQKLARDGIQRLIEAQSTASDAPTSQTPDC